MLFKLAVISQVVLLIYFEITTLVNLYPWNDLSNYSLKEKIVEAAVNGLIMVIGIGLFVSQLKVLMLISVMFWFIHLVMQLLNWWMPYLFGIHLNQFPKSLYDTHFKGTIKWLPPIKDHIIPDAQHNVLQLLTLIVGVLSLVAVVV